MDEGDNLETGRKKGEINDEKTRLQKKNKLEEYNEMDRQDTPGKTDEVETNTN